MATSLTSEPAQRPPQATAEEIFARVSVREQKLSRLLVFYISGGLLFMLLPGTFLGVWNLVSSKYPPAEPGALVCEPLEAAVRGR